METRNFTIGSLINVGTGVLVTSMDDVYDLLGFLSGQELSTVGLIVAQDLHQKDLLAQHPFLKDIEPRLWDYKDVAASNYFHTRLAELALVHGDTLPVTRPQAAPTEAVEAGFNKIFSAKR